MTVSDPEKRQNRRPLKVRQSELVARAAKWLSQRDITPNQISLLSIFFAFLAASCLIFLRYSSNITASLLAISAALCIQCRLLCNLFDGMVAVEGGKKTASGELFNDIPDRIADPLIIVATGYAITVTDWGIPLSWFAALLALMTAYIRTLASSIGAPVSFAGPLAKQQRMALLTTACCITAVEPYLWQRSYALLVALVIMVPGTLLTVYRRIRFAYKALEATKR